MEWEVAISWQLRGLRGNYGIYEAVTGSYVALTGRLPCKPRNSHAHSGVSSTPSGVILTPLVVISTHFGAMFKLYIGCNFNTWGCGPLLTPTGVILTSQFLQCSCHIQESPTLFRENYLAWLLRNGFTRMWDRGTRSVTVFITRHDSVMMSFISEFWTLVLSFRDEPWWKSRPIPLLRAHNYCGLLRSNVAIHGVPKSRTADFQYTLQSESVNLSYKTSSSKKEWYPNHSILIPW